MLPSSSPQKSAVLRRLKLEQTHAVLVHSEKASAEAFDDLTAAGYRLALDAPLRSAWSDMLCADVLVMARSSFSYVPALFRGAKAQGGARGRVVYQPHPTWERVLPPLPSWEPFVSSSTR